MTWVPMGPGSWTACTSIPIESKHPKTEPVGDGHDLDPFGSGPWTASTAKERQKNKRREKWMKEEMETFEDYKHSHFKTGDPATCDCRFFIILCI